MLFRSYWPRFKIYWRVTIRCQDRAKLFFDTVCTLADLDYEVYHATVVSYRERNMAFQDFYVRPRFGEIDFNQDKAQKLYRLRCFASGVVQTGTTHVSTPFPHPGSNFRFSYCRGDQARMENDTPFSACRLPKLWLRSSTSSAFPPMPLPFCRRLVDMVEGSQRRLIS